MFDVSDQPPMAPLQDIPWVLSRLDWMRQQRIWPNGLRYLWTDACGVMLLTSLWHATGNPAHIQTAEWVVSEVYRVLGRPRGIRIGEEPDRDGQYMHYLTLWMAALAHLGDVKPEYRSRGIDLVKQIHPAFVMPLGTGGLGTGMRTDTGGVWWKMKEDLSGPYPGYGLGGLDPYDGLLAYKLLDPQEKHLAREVADMRGLVDATYNRLDCTQDLGLGMLLRVTAHFPQEQWAQVLQTRCISTLDGMWQPMGPGKGYFSRSPWHPRTKIAFSNYGTSVGVQCVGGAGWPDRVQALNTFFEGFKSHDEYDDKAITWVMACNSHFPGVMAPDHVHGLAKRPWPTVTTGLAQPTEAAMAGLGQPAQVMGSSAEGPYAGAGGSSAGSYPKPAYEIKAGGEQGLAGAAGAGQAVGQPPQASAAGATASSSAHRSMQ